MAVAIAGRLRSFPALSVAIAVAWLIVGLAQLTGRAALLHHHTLIEGGPPLVLAAPLFLLGWLVMIIAMMLPGSLPAIATVRIANGSSRRPRFAESAFVAAFATAWTTYGLLAFAGDVIVHRTVDATPWLAARPWIIEATILLIAAGYQFSPTKRRSLAACRHPGSLLRDRAQSERGWFRLGLHHGLACLGSSWALMLVMFGEGFANLGWMVALTALMVYEATGSRGQRAARFGGLVLLLAGLVVVSGPLLASG